MDKKNKIIVFVLVVAVLALGVAYAGITNQILNITGSASATPNDANFKVKFTGTPTTGGNGTTTATVSGDKTATISVSGLTTKGQKATAKYTILNDSDELSAKITSGTITNSNSTYFSVTTDLAAAGTTLVADGTVDVTVTVELIKTPISDVSTNVTVPFTAEAVEP